MVANYTNKHIIFNKGQCIGHIEPTIDKMPQTPESSVTTQKMKGDQVQPDTFTSPLHHLPLKLQCSIDELLDSLKTGFVNDEMNIGMTNVTKMQIDTGTSNPVSQKPYPSAMKHYTWVKNDINKLFSTKGIHSSQSTWSAPS